MKNIFKYIGVFIIITIFCQLFKKKYCFDETVFDKPVENINFRTKNVI